MLLQEGRFPKILVWQTATSCSNICLATRQDSMELTSMQNLDYVNTTCTGKIVHSVLDYIQHIDGILRPTANRLGIDRWSNCHRDHIFDVVSISTYLST